jgi:hypothetical protein
MVSGINISTKWPPTNPNFVLQNPSAYVNRPGTHESANTVGKDRVRNAPWAVGALHIDTVFCGQCTFIYTGVFTSDNKLDQLVHHRIHTASARQDRAPPQQQKLLEYVLYCQWGQNRTERMRMLQQRLCHFYDSTRNAGHTTTQNGGFDAPAGSICLSLDISVKCRDNASQILSTHFRTRATPMYSDNIKRF